jgi:hypothetical protein
MFCDQVQLLPRFNTVPIYRKVSKFESWFSCHQFQSLTLALFVIYNYNLPKLATFLKLCSLCSCQVAVYIQYSQSFNFTRGFYGKSPRISVPGA